MICQLFHISGSLFNSMMNFLFFFFFFLVFGDTLQLGLCPVRLSGHATASLFFNSSFSIVVC